MTKSAPKVPVVFCTTNLGLTFCFLQERTAHRTFSFCINWPENQKHTFPSLQRTSQHHRFVQLERGQRCTMTTLACSRPQLLILMSRRRSRQTSSASFSTALAVDLTACPTRTAIASAFLRNMTSLNMSAILCAEAFNATAWNFQVLFSGFSCFPWI